MRAYLHLFLRLVPYLVLSTVTFHTSAADKAQSLFADHRSGVYQIRLIELASGKKSSIGSGFKVAEGGLMATNFHVISDAVHKPEKYRLEYIGFEGDKGTLQIVGFDVVHDLALVKQEVGENSQKPNSARKRKGLFKLAKRKLQQGEDIFSLGNPFDLGTTVVPGTYNGLIENNFHEKIHFTGSLNPGMSGGPAINARGRVIGVNVATSGNQVSFLVPLKYLARLLEHYQQNPELDDSMALIGQQLLADQEEKFAQLLQNPWPIETLGQANVMGEITPFTRCWGDTSDNPDLRYVQTYSRCAANDSVYVGRNLNTGSLEYEFYWFETEQLSPMQFYTRYQNGYGNINASNQAGKEDVTNFDCHQDFVATHPTKSTDGNWKTTFCSRAYKDYPGLYDVLFISAYLGATDKGLITHFALTGVSQKNSLAFAKRFMEQVRWN